MQNILSKFLDAGLLQIGEDDEKLNLLEEAASDLGSQLIANPILTYRFALVGLDSRSKIDDPVMKIAETAVRSKWQTIANKIGPHPVQLYRAVVLRAIEVAATDDSEITLAFTLIAKNEPTLHLSLKEEEAVYSMIEHFERFSEKEVRENWVQNVSFTLPKLDVKTRKIPNTKEELVNAISRAVGPSDKSGKVLPSPNPHWPDAGASWSYEFASRAADAVLAVVQNSSKSFIEDLQVNIREGMSSLAGNLERLAMRDAKSELLWIRASMYSESAQCSYKDLTATDLILHAALDVSQSVTEFSPVSVEYFLRNIVESLTKESLPLKDVMARIPAILEDFSLDNSYFKDELPANGRRSWLKIGLDSSTTEKFEDQSGVESNYLEGASEIAVRFYRELQIRKLLYLEL